MMLTPWAWSSSSVETRSTVDRPHLESSVTKMAPISRRLASSITFRRSGLLLLAPDAVSLKTATT
jgi:hypothetical protein